MTVGGYGVVRSMSRAPRAVVAFEYETDWVGPAMDVLRWQSGRWGGADGFIAPVRAGTPIVDEHLLRLIALGDPDVVVHRRCLLRDLSDEQIVSELADGSSISGAAGLDVATARNQIGDLPIGPDLGSEVARTFARWCAPRHPWELDDGEPISDPMLFSHDCPDPFTAIPLVTGLNARAVAFDLDGLDPMFALLVATRAGLSPDGRREALIRPTEQDLPGLAEWAMTGSIAYGGLPCIDEIVSGSGTDVTSDDMYRALPLPTTEWGLDWLSHPTVHRTVVVVIGDTPEDHALAVAANHHASLGAWVPARLLGAADEYSAAMNRGLAATMLRSRIGGRVSRRLLTSASLSIPELQELAAKVPGPPSDIEYVDVASLDLRDRRFLGDGGSIGRQSSHPVSTVPDGVSVLTSLEPPVPAALAQIEEGSWFVDVSIDGAPMPPVRSAISGDVLLASPPSSEGMAPLIRSSAGGMSYWSHGAMLVLAGWPREATLARPLVRFPGARDVVAALARSVGLRAETSTPGRRAVRVADLWGGHSELAAALRGPTRRLLDGFCPDEPSGPYDHGCAVDGRGYVAFPSAASLLALALEEARATLDDLLTRGVLRRGLLLRCGRCDHLHFYGTEEFAQTFACKSCIATNTLTQERWRLPVEEPQWFYALDPLVADLLKDHGDVPILAAHEILSRTQKPGDAAFETNFFEGDSPKPLIEIDFACIVEGRLYLGEAKSNGRLQVRKRSLAKAARRFADITVRLEADQFVVASGSSEWSDATHAALDLALAEASARVGAPTPTAEYLVLP
ncbi:MAG: hypothetical protein JWM89_1313 [Acidimicrobiales bacterium]|nr:hypothetical protein [Acidimicrobiales bacterium]